MRDLHAADLRLYTDGKEINYVYVNLVMICFLSKKQVNPINSLAKSLCINGHIL